MTTAIITDDFRKNNLDTFFEDVFNSPNDSTNPGKNYYIGIGKTDPWPEDQFQNNELSSGFDPPEPTGSILEKEDIKKNLMTLKKIKPTDIHRVIPQVVYRAGQKYKKYDKTDPTCFDADDANDLFPCYAIYTDNDGNTKLYICLANGTTTTGPAKTIGSIPTMGSNNAAPANFPYGVEANTNDGYIWAYMDFYNKSALTNLFGDSTTFVNLTEDRDIDTVMNNITGHSAGYADGRKRATQASAGLLYGFKINFGGSGYPINRTGVNALDAIILGKRLDGTTIGRTSTGSIERVKVETNSEGRVNKVIWTLAQALAFGYGRTSTTNSAGATVTGLSVQGGAASPLAGIDEASLQIIDAEVNEGATGFEEADIQPLIAPAFGFGHSVVEDMPSYYAGISADFKGNVGDNATASLNDTPPQYIGEALSNVYVRQVSLLRDTDGNMRPNGEDDSPYPDPNLAAEDALNCLQYFQIRSQDNSVFAAIGEGAWIEQAETISAETGLDMDLSKARAWFDKASKVEPLDPGGSSLGGYRIYYHQNSEKKVNLRPFNGTGDINIYNAENQLQATVTYEDIRQAEYAQDTGEVLFVDNRKPILRNEQQTEEVRLIIQF